MRTIAMATAVPLFVSVVVTIAFEIYLLANMSVAPVAVLVAVVAVVVVVVAVVVVMSWGWRIRKEELPWIVSHSLPACHGRLAWSLLETIYGHLTWSLLQTIVCLLS
jgi:hypothetical protein